MSELVDVVTYMNRRFRQIDAQLCALRLVVANHAAVAYIDSGLTPEMVEQNHAQLRHTMQQMTFSNLSPADSDDWAAELETAADEILRLIETSYAGKQAI